jgi:hypothetical protein
VTPGRSLRATAARVPPSLVAGTVRFAELLKAAGTPRVYFPLADPQHDREFMRAVREERVLSLKQNPAGKQKDFGAIGFLPEKFVSYLLFPKSLAPFKDRRVTGIKYDALEQAEISAPRARSAPKRSIRPAKPKPKPRPRPRPKRFTATVRRIATSEIKVTVQALDERKARRRAAEIARDKTDLPHPRVETELLSVVED